MCGIVGLTWNDQALTRRMAGCLAHRGPDQDGVYTDDSVSLGHRRLSILDLSENGRQPLSNEDGTVWVTFNGEIYNYPALRDELLAKGHAFRSKTDTEVIVHAYEEYGPACVERLQGMFAFAVWDRKTRTLLLARDRLGIKPLYYAEEHGRLIFASEIKAILQVPGIDRTIDPQSIYHYLGFEFVPAPDTIFTHIHKLAPGHRLIWRNGQSTIEEYWDLAFDDTPRSVEYYEAGIRERLEACVRSHLMSDVPLGVFLSGGLDSSALVAMMHRAGVNPIHTFSLGYEDKSFSELDYARIIAKQFNTVHREFIIEPVTPALIEQAVWHLDEPMADLSAIPFYLICQQARKHVTVCLSGEGGDEVFIGYDRFKASKINSAFARLPGWVRRGVLGPLVDALPDQPQKKGPVNLLKRFVQGSRLPEDGEHMRWQYFGLPDREEELFARDVLAHVARAPFAPVARHASRQRDGRRLDREVYVDLRFMMPDSVLMKVDKMSMAHALEVRVPFLDHTFVEFCASIPGDLKLKGFTTKAIFRRAMQGILPDTILNRGKQGYSLPIKNWLRSELKEYMTDLLDSSPVIAQHFNKACVQRLIQEHLSYRQNHNHILWALTNLAVWHRRVLENATSTRNGHEEQPSSMRSAQG